jgi:hypothetical protein
MPERSLFYVSIISFTIFHCIFYSFLLHQFPNYMVEWDYPFTKDMQNGGVDNVISDVSGVSSTM